ncbi:MULTISPECIES: DUF4192 family protein [Brevibacterium]|nr:DUF4192 family protein [Brevibacterium casei]MCT1552023.1 DUF4192 domain-containing protein [Brevibacterium casei]MCT1561843.1 DUF4192 domain-containing protein [Brevibacterium casei]MCT2209753.1 DUF4192 domain-containing protein [Brevibacterium casei]QPS33077.1 DUF4192 family protein [Brevibacterium casei]VEW12441.1 Uncharacterised protein [Brevibacterium casei]
MDTPAKTAEDLIGIVPHTLGYTPASSLVAILVVTDGDGVQSCGTTMRVDFDLETAAMTLAEGGEWLRDLVCRACAPSGVFLILYDDDYIPAGAVPERFGPTRGHGDGVGDRVGFGDGAGGDSVCDDDADEDWFDEDYAGLHRGLVRAATDEMATALGDAGIATLSAWWVSGGRFGRIDDGEDPGTDIALAQSSACATELVSTGSAPAAGPADLVVRPVDAEAAAEYRSGAADPRPSVEESFGRLGEIYPTLLEMRAGTEAFDRERLEALMTPDVVCAFDRLLAAKWSRDALEMILSFDHPDFLPKRMCRLAPAELARAARRAGASRLAAEQMIGLSARAPQPRDILLAIDLCEAYVHWSGPETLATAYGVIAWFHWSLGGSTLAEQYAFAALDHDPHHSLAELLVSAIGQGFLPQWLMPEPRGARDL